LTTGFGFLYQPLDADEKLRQIHLFAEPCHNLDPNALDAVRLENVGVLSGLKSDNGESAH
jgi:hypothetical protein